MKISFERLSKKLSQCGFERALANVHVIGSCMFVRRDADPRLFQQIRVECSRRKHGPHAVDAHVAVTVVRWNTPWRAPLSEERVLQEVASNEPAPPPWRFGNWDSDIKTRSDATAWEDLLARVGPPAAAEFAAQTGPIVLQRTETMRELANRALAKLDPSVPVETQIERFRGEIGEPFAAQVEMATRALGYGLPGTAGISRLACFALADEPEFKGVVAAATRPLLKHELGWPIDLVADAILSWDSHQNEEIRADLRFLGRGRRGVEKPSGLMLDQPDER